jgi:hypothetical protein
MIIKVTTLSDLNAGGFVFTNTTYPTIIDIIYTTTN